MSWTGEGVSVLGHVTEWSVLGQVMSECPGTGEGVSVLGQVME